MNYWTIACALLCMTSAPSAESSPSTSAALPESITLDGIIHPDSDDTLAFMPNGRTVFFDRSEGARKTIMVTSMINGKWSKPKVADFSGHWFDQDPVVAPDGSYLLFNSDRPVTPDQPPLIQNYFKGGPGPGSNIWRVDRKGNGWSAPVWLDRNVNSDVFIDFASIAADGTLYFMRWNEREKAMHIWRSTYRENLEFGTEQPFRENFAAGLIIRHEEVEYRR